MGLHWLTAADGEDSGDENSDEKQPADIDYNGSAASAGVNAKSSMGEINHMKKSPGSNSNTTFDVVNPVIKLHIPGTLKICPFRS